MSITKKTIKGMLSMSREAISIDLQRFFSEEQPLGVKVNKMVVLAQIAVNRKSLDCLVLDNIDFSNMNMSDFNFEGSKITNCSFIDCDLTNTDWSFATIENCNFGNSVLCNSKMIDGKFRNCNFEFVGLFYAFNRPDDLHMNNIKVDVDLTSGLSLKPSNYVEAFNSALKIIKHLNSEKINGFKSYFYTINYFIKINQSENSNQYDKEESEELAKDVIGSYFKNN